MRTGAYLAGGGALLLAVTMLLSAWGLRRGLRPLSALAAEAALVSPSNWHLPGNVAVEATDELAPLAQAMQAMLDNLRKAFTQQREFLANAAHELKTPVAILKSTLQALLQRQRSAGEYRAGLEEALEDMARLEKLLHSMLRLARAEQWATGSVQPDAAPVNAMESLQAAIDRLAPIAAERDVTIEVKGEREALVRTSSEDLELVWANLLENAIHFSPAGAQVAAMIRKQNRRILLVVEDRGPGIPESELPRIFERFHRVDVSRARHTGGYGLGLAISKALVEAYGGDLRAESKAGIGTRLTASFPEAARALAKEPQTTFSVP